MNDQEAKVFQSIAGSIKGGPLFNDSDLFEDFCRGLETQSLLQASEKEALKIAKAPIALYALVSMHNRSIKLEDGSLATLSVCEDAKGRLAIFASAKVFDDASSGPLHAATWVFETRLPVRDYCELGVAPLRRALFMGDLEVTSDLKLGRPV